MQETTLSRELGYWKGCFKAMASPCEVLMELEDEGQAKKILALVSNEAFRIERKYSRYRKDNIVFKINNASAGAIKVDTETARLLDFADELYRMSDGLFDITSGVLRQVWRFDGSDKVPHQKMVSQVLTKVGWDKVSWRDGEICLAKGMEIDLGGIGKEYAVDSCAAIVKEVTDQSVLINFGGDLVVTNKREDDQFWSVGRFISSSLDQNQQQSIALFQLSAGAIATSGDEYRYLLKDGIRYSHVLNPKTGWPIEQAPHTVSVAAATCVEAGMMSTLALLHGNQAEDFLRLQDLMYFVS